MQRLKKCRSNCLCDQHQQAVDIGHPVSYRSKFMGGATKLAVYAAAHPNHRQKGRLNLGFKRNRLGRK